MKRMSEAFELPVKTGDGFGCCLLHSKGAPIASFNCEDDSSYAAHAINHVDALADALGDIVFDYFATINLSSVDIATLNPELHKKMTAATDALAAYRGNK